MSEIGDFAVKVFENRKEKLKTIEERKRVRDENYRKRVEQYAKLIIDVFDASNLEENSDLLVWKVEVKYSGYKTLNCSVSFSNEVEGSWQNIDNMERWEYYERVKRVIEAIKRVESPDYDAVLIKDIYEFLEQNISSSYDFELLEEDRLKISMHDPSDEYLFQTI